MKNYGEFLFLRLLFVVKYKFKSNYVVFFRENWKFSFFKLLYLLEVLYWLEVIVGGLKDIGKYRFFGQIGYQLMFVLKFRR